MYWIQLSYIYSSLTKYLPFSLAHSLFVNNNHFTYSLLKYVFPTQPWPSMRKGFWVYVCIRKHWSSETTVLEQSANNVQHKLLMTLLLHECVNFVPRVSKPTGITPQAFPITGPVKPFCGHRVMYNIYVFVPTIITHDMTSVFYTSL